jgi:cell division protein ZapA (FtsZ GTPase activity inhibitor)
MAELKPIKIQILGREYLIKTDGDERYISELCNYLDAKAKEVMASGGSVTTLDVMIKTAVMLADELFQLKEENLNLKHHIEMESKRLIEYIDEKIQSNPK